MAVAVLPVLPVPTKSRSGRKHSEFAAFMRRELPRYRAKNRGVAHRDAYRVVAQVWVNLFGPTPRAPGQRRP